MFVRVYVYNDCTRTYTHCSLLQQIYCIWLRFMGAKIGKNVFISPENGGFREIDFMNIGNDCGELITIVLLGSTSFSEIESFMYSKPFLT